MSNKATLNRLLNDFYPYAKEYLGFDKDADVYFVSDVDNANKPLGKTAYYDPAKREISVYTDNRHPKDIMRSVSHELVHHAQNCRGDLGMSEHTGQGYAQNDEHLREMEREAYEKGNLCFRDWEDGIKSNLEPGTIYESRARRSKNSMNNFKTLNENFKSFLQQEGSEGYEAGDKVKDLRNDTVGTVVEPMAGGAVIELEDGTIVKTRDKFLEKVEGEAMQEALPDEGMAEYGRQDAAAGRPPSKAGRKNKEYMDAYEQERENQISAREKKFGDALDAETMQEYGDHETQAQGGMVSSSHSSDPEFDQVEDIALTVIEQGGQLMQIATALQDEAFDARVMSGVLVIGDKYFIGKPDKFDISPDEEFREIGPYVLGYSSSQDPMDESFRGSPEEKEMTSKMSNKEFSDYHTRDKHIVPDLKGDMEPIPGMEGPFQFASGAVLYYDPKAGKYYDRGKDMYLDNEEAAQLTMENKKMNLKEKVVASVMAALNEGGSMAEYGAIDAEDGNPPSKIGQGDPAYMEAYNAVLVARGEEPLPIVQPDQAYLDALHSGNLEEMYDDDPYADEDPYMADLEAEFPWLADKKKGGRPPSAEDEAAAAAAAADAAAAGEFGMGRDEEEDEESPRVMKEQEWAPERSRDDVKYGGQIHLIPDVQFTRNIEADIQDLPPEILNWLYGELESGDAIEDGYGTVYAGADVQDVVAGLPDELFERNKNNNGETNTMRLKTNIFEDENAFTETLRGRVMKRLQELSKGQEEMDLDDDGKIEPEDLAGLRAGKEDEDVGEEAEEKKEESLRDRVRRIVQETLGGGDDPEAKMQAIIQDILAASPEGVETNDLIDAIQRAHPEIGVPEIIDFMQSGAMDISSDEATGNWHLEEGKYKKEADDDDGDSDKEEMEEGKYKKEADDDDGDKEEQNEAEEAEGDDPEADGEEKEKQEEQIATNPQDFFRKLRNESRTVVKEDWNKNSKTKRSAMLNERLMKSWFNK